MKRLKEIFQRQQFDPGFLGIFINPFYIVRKELRRSMTHFSKYIRGDVLDVGCGHRPYQSIFNLATLYTGVEFDSPANRKRFKNIDAWYDGLHLPFAEKQFDALIVTQVLEHVFNPDVFMSEIARVTKPGGHLLLTVPFIWDEHEQPHDYARYSSFALTYLLKKNGFETVEHIKTAPDIRVIFQLINCYIHKRLKLIKSYTIRMICFTILTAPFTILGSILRFILPKNFDLYMDNVILATKKH